MNIIWVTTIISIILRMYLIFITSSFSDSNNPLNISSDTFFLLLGTTFLFWGAIEFLLNAGSYKAILGSSLASCFLLAFTEPFKGGTGGHPGVPSILALPFIFLYMVIPGLVGALILNGYLKKKKNL